MKPKVSIIIPVYNDEKHVARAIESALNQTMKEVEVIVVDDGSTDGTPEVLKCYESRIKVIRQENKGVAGARNTGIAHSEGKYLCFLDQDDTLMPTKAELQAEVLETHPEAGLCYGAWQWIDPRDWAVVKIRNVNPLLPDRSCGPFPPHFQIAAAMIRREWLDKVGGFDEEFKTADDTDLCFRLWAAGCRFLPIDRVVSTWTLRAGNESSDMWIEHLKALERHFEAMGAAIPEAVRNKHRAETLFTVGAGHLRAGRVSDARTAFTQAFEYDASLLTKERTYRRILRFVDPCHPLKSNDTFPDVAVVWRNMCGVIKDTCADGEGDGACKAKGRLSKSKLAYAVSSFALSKGRKCRARWWAVRSLIASRGKSEAGAKWRRVIEILLGPTLTRPAVFVLAVLRRLKGRVSLRKVS